MRCDCDEYECCSYYKISDCDEPIFSSIDTALEVEPNASDVHGIFPPLIPQEFIDACLRARLLVDALHDHRAIERGAGRIPDRLSRQRARHHDGIGWYLAHENLAARAVDDLGGGAEIDAHRQHRALAHDDALGDLRAGADEAAVLDHHRPRLQRLQHPADAG